MNRSREVYPDSVETKYVLSPRVDLDQAIEDLRHR